MKLIETQYSRMPWSIEARETLCSQRCLTYNMSNIIIPCEAEISLFYHDQTLESRVFLIFRVLVLPIIGYPIFSSSSTRCIIHFFFEKISNLLKLFRVLN